MLCDGIAFSCIALKCAGSAVSARCQRFSFLPSLSGGAVAAPEREGRKLLQARLKSLKPR
eukprot:11292108-Alexandrium_andersonii.AAC.1